MDWQRVVHFYEAIASLAIRKAELEAARFTPQRADCFQTLH